MTANEKIKINDNKKEKDIAQYDLDKQLRFWLYHQQILVNMNF